MTIFLLIYLMTAVMILSILLMTTSEGFKSMEKSKKVFSVAAIVLLAILWFPVLLYITIWTMVRKIKMNNFQN